MSISSACSSAVVRFISDYGGNVFQKKNDGGKKSQIGNLDGTRGTLLIPLSIGCGGQKLRRNGLGVTRLSA
jgi:hypothetical protein